MVKSSWLFTFTLNTDINHLQLFILSARFSIRLSLSNSFISNTSLGLFLLFVQGSSEIPSYISV